MTRLWAMAAAMMPAAAMAATPVVVNQAGRLLDDNDQPVSGAKSLDFQIFDASTGGVSKWKDTFNVTLQNGTYAVSLGGGADGHKALDAALFAGDRWLQVSVDGVDLLPRLRFGAVPSALHALAADDATTLGGHPVSDFLLIGSGGSLGDVSGGTITATTKFVGTLEGKADGATLADQASAPAPGFTLDAAKLTGTVDAAKVSGALTNATIDGSHVTGTVDGAKIGGALANATLDGSKITGTLSGATVPAARVTGALANATIPVGNVTGTLNAAQLGGIDATGYQQVFTNNLLPGGTFEEGGLYYWRTGNGAASNNSLPVLDASTAHSGKYSLKFAANGTGSSIRGGLIPVKTGAHIRISAWAKGTVVPGSQGYNILYLLGRWFAADGSNGGTSNDGCGQGGCPDLGLVSGTVANWTYVSATYTVPANAAFWSAVDLGLNGNATGTGWVDDVRVETDASDSAAEPPLQGFKYARWDTGSDYRNDNNTQGTCASGWCMLPNRTIQYVKHRPDTVLKITYDDTLGTLGVDYGACTWAMMVQPGASAISPGAGGRLYNSFSAADLTRGVLGRTWMMQHSTHTALAPGLGAGVYTISVWNSINTSSASECLSGWNQGGGNITIEEMVSQN